MESGNYRLVLASASPRRRELLTKLGQVFEVKPCDIDEYKIDGENGEAYVLRTARRKCQVASENTEGEKTLVIAADTAVCIDDDILGKPADENDAVSMLKRLSGREHTVITGLAVKDTLSGVMIDGSIKTSVFFRKLTDEEIESYVASGEPMGKAGAYAIQGLGSLLIRRIEGDYFNVVGLPLNYLYEVLQKFHFNLLNTGK